MVLQLLLLPEYGHYRTFLRLPSHEVLDVVQGAGVDDLSLCEDQAASVYTHQSSVAMGTAVLPVMSTSGACFSCSYTPSENPAARSASAAHSPFALFAFCS